MTSRRGSAAIAVGLLLVLAVTGCTLGRERAANGATERSDADGATSSADAGTLTWEPCEDDETIECGTLVVPAPAGEEGTTELSVSRRPARVPDQRLGVLVTAGSPFAPAGAHLRSFGFPPALADRFDIVAMDLRGRGPAGPVECGDAPADLLAVDPSPDDPAEQQELEEAAQAVAEACAASTPLERTASAAAAADLELLRTALDESLLSFFMLGDSAPIALAYAEAHPDHVRAVVLDGPPGVRAPIAELIRAQGQAADQALERAFALCALVGCTEDEPRAVYETVLQQAEDGSLAGPDGAAISPSDLAGAIRGATLVFSDDRPISLLEDLEAAAAGDTANLATLAAGARNPEALGTYLGVACMDHAMDDPAAVIDAVADATEASPSLGALNGAMLLPCASWAVPAAPLAALTTSSPVLLLANEIDPIAPLPLVEALAEELSAGHLVVVDSFGHLTAGRSACAVHALSDFLLDPSAELPDTCAAGSGDE